MRRYRNVGALAFVAILAWPLLVSPSGLVCSTWRSTSSTNSGK